MVLGVEFWDPPCQLGPIISDRFADERFDSREPWHAAGEDELVVPAMDKVAPLVAQGYLHDHSEFDIMTEGLAKMSAASDSLVAARETAAMTAVLRIHLDKED